MTLEAFCLKEKYENSGRYGYRRIRALLIRGGEITPSVPNVIDRDFHANVPNEKWLTDIAEFSIPAGKIYLSPIVDCFDGLIPCRMIASAPDAELDMAEIFDALSAVRPCLYNLRPLGHTVLSGNFLCIHTITPFLVEKVGLLFQLYSYCDCTSFSTAILGDVLFDAYSNPSDPLPFHFNRLGNKMEKDTAGCRVHHHKFMVTREKSNETK